MYKPVLILHQIDNVISITQLVTIHYLELPKDFVYDGEVHDVWEVVYVDKGSIEVAAEDRRMTLRQGGVVFHKPNEFHSLRADGRTAPNVFIITFATSSRLMRFFEDRHFTLPAGYRRLIASIIEEGRQAFQLPFFDVHMKELVEKPDAPVGAQQLIRIYLEQLLIRIVRDQTLGEARYKFLPNKGDVDDHIAGEIIRLLEENLYGGLKIEDVCRQMNYGKTFLSSVFRAKTGYAIKEYYNLLKIAEAKKLLREGSHNITQIAQLLQFETSQYFSRVFSKTTGMTPSEYTRSIGLQ